MHRFLLAFAILSVLGPFTSVRAQAPRVLPSGTLPNDARLKPLKDLNGYFPFIVPKTQREWRIRKARMRRHLLVSVGLWPLPERTPLKPVVHGARDMGDYIIEKAYFQSFPGFYVTGNIYRPKNAKGRLPAVLSPHGHWPNGRFYDAGNSATKNAIQRGGEQFEDGGRSPLQSRCVHLARMGCVVFHYDMIGYADSRQISHNVSHRIRTQRPHMNHPTRWGLFSPQAESRLQSVMGLQTWNSIRALDYLESRPDVDPNRIGVTGASGGGTQTFMVCAVDPRPAAAFPAVMVSTAMQGGCTCENACCLRVGTGNIEFAAMFAPKPQGLTAANDWTKQMDRFGFPELRRHYTLLGKPDNVMLLSRTEFGHNYNQVSRHAMYRWFNQHLKIGSKRLRESSYKRLTADELTVWEKEGKHKLPEIGEGLERKLLRHWTNDTTRQLTKLIPRDKKSLYRYKEVVAGGIDALIGRRMPKPSNIDFDQKHKIEKKDHVQVFGLLKHRVAKEELPIVFLYPKQWNKQVVIFAHPKGKAGLFQQDGEITAVARLLLNKGMSVVGVDLLYQGEFLKKGQTISKTRKVGNPREVAAYTLGYNSSLFAKRVHDLMTVIRFVRNHEYTPKAVHMVGLGNTGPLVLAARSQARDEVTKAVAATGSFRFASVTDYRSPDFLPGGAKYHDLLGMIAVAAPDPVCLVGETKKSVGPVIAAYKAGGALQNLELAKSIADGFDWLLK